jgi:hypothetical protein
VCRNNIFSTSNNYGSGSSESIILICVGSNPPFDSHSIIHELYLWVTIMPSTKTKRPSVGPPPAVGSPEVAAGSQKRKKPARAAPTTAKPQEHEGEFELHRGQHSRREITETSTERPAAASETAIRIDTGLATDYLELLRDKKRAKTLLGEKVKVPKDGSPAPQTQHEKICDFFEELTLNADQLSKNLTKTRHELASHKTRLEETRSAEEEVRADFAHYKTVSVPIEKHRELEEQVDELEDTLASTIAARDETVAGTIINR